EPLPSRNGPYMAKRPTSLTRYSPSASTGTASGELAAARAQARSPPPDRQRTGIVPACPGSVTGYWNSADASANLNLTSKPATAGTDADVAGREVTRHQSR